MNRRYRLVRRINRQVKNKRTPIAFKCCNLLDCFCIDKGNGRYVKKIRWSQSILNTDMYNWYWLVFILLHFKSNGLSSSWWHETHYCVYLGKSGINEMAGSKWVKPIFVLTVMGTFFCFEGFWFIFLFIA